MCVFVYSRPSCKITPNEPPPTAEVVYEVVLAPHILGVRDNSGIRSARGVIILSELNTIIEL